MAVTSFEKGHWYRYTIKHTVKPDQWNLKMMDVCDGEPCYCIFGKGAYAEFRGHGHYDSDQDSASVRLIDVTIAGQLSW